MSVDLYECELALLKDEKKIKQFVKELVNLLQMKAYGEPLVVHFGDDPRVEGYSMFQLIETSGIAGPGH